MPFEVSPSQRSAIAPFHVMEVMKAASRRQATRGDVLHLEVGQPSTPAPSAVLAAAAAALTVDRLGYTDALGVPALRQAIASQYRRGGIEVDPSQVVVTVGASGGFVLALLAALDVGDRVGMTEPGYAAYRNIIAALDLELVGIPIDATSRWVPTRQLVEAAGPLDALVVASPSNPTGTALHRSEMEALAEACTSHGAVLISDEIYHGITYGAPAVSALEVTSDAIIVQSFSKYFSMTGWRLGWLVVPPVLVSPLERLAQNLFISPPTLAQLAAVAAFDATGELDGNVDRYAESRRTLLDALARWDLPHAPADGAFYLWVDITRLGMPSTELCRRLLDETGVAVTPGIDFDPVRGEEHLRISYSESPGDIAEAVGRLDAWLTAFRPA
jgi:aspartate/methionine/tyrosine aminotransferase